MKIPMDDVAEIHSQIEFDENPLEIVPWPKDEEYKVATDLLKDMS